MQRHLARLGGVLAAALLWCGTAAANPIERASFAYAPVNDTTLFYRQKGDGPPALFLHAFLVNSDLWLDQINGLQDACRCIALDMRGFGRSEPSSAERLDPYLYAEDVLAFLDALGISEPVHLVGMSVGAFIAGLAYEAAPERVASLTFISAAFDFQRDPTYERYQKEMARLAVVEGKDAVFRRFDEYIDGSAATLHSRARYKTMLLDTRTEMIVAYLTGAGQTGPRPDLPAKIKAPVLIPVGEQDVVMTPQKADAMAASFPNARVIEIAKAGRLLSIESPNELNAALRAFWREAEGR